RTGCGGLALRFFDLVLTSFGFGQVGLRLVAQVLCNLRVGEELLVPVDGFLVVALEAVRLRDREQHRRLRTQRVRGEEFLPRIRDLLLLELLHAALVGGPEVIGGLRERRAADQDEQERDRTNEMSHGNLGTSSFPSPSRRGGSGIQASVGTDRGSGAASI